MMRSSGSLARAAATIAAGAHFLVVLDEIMYPLRYGWLPLQGVLDGLRQRPAQVHVVLTGRNAPDELTALADTVTEMVPIKHHHQAGVPAQRDIDDGGAVVGRPGDTGSEVLGRTVSVVVKHFHRQDAGVRGHPGDSYAVSRQRRDGAVLDPQAGVPAQRGIED